MYFDKFDICEAYSLILDWWNVGGDVHERPGIGGGLYRIGYRPSPMFSYDTMSENAKYIFWNAVKRLNLPVNETVDKIRLRHYAGA